jgi:hypothetical protein
MGRWYGDKRDTVEDCRALAVGDFHRRGWLRAGAVGTSRWSRGGQETGSIGWDCDGAALWLDYTVTPRDGSAKRDYRYPVRLVRTPQPFGGERVWFACPRCGRAVAKLYMAPASCYFECRECQGLSYQSRQDRQHAFWRLWDRARRLEEQLATTAPRRRRWRQTRDTLDAVTEALCERTPLPALLARYDAHLARETERAARAPRRPGRPSKRELRERARQTRLAAQFVTPRRGPGRPTVKRPYTQRQPWALATPPAPGLVYCVRCRDRRPLVRGQAVTLTNGRPALRGSCATCGTMMTRIVAGHTARPSADQELPNAPGNEVVRT